MAFSPAADPWGTAMLAAAAVVALALFVLVAAIVTGTPKRAGGRILGVGSFLFLVAAVGGTWVRVLDSDATAKEAAKPKPKPVTIVAPTPPPDPDGEPSAATEATAADDAGDHSDHPPAAAGASATPTAVVDTPTDPSAPTPPPAPTPTPAATENLAPSEPANIDTSPVALAQPAALPSDDAAKRQAVATAIRLAKAAASDDGDCGDPKVIGEHWLVLKALPTDARGLTGAVAKLESCRKKIRSAKAYWVRRKRVDARNAYAEELPAKLRRDESYVFVSVRGSAHERMRIGGKSITPDRMQSLLDGGLETQLRALGFSEVTFASGKSTSTKKYDVTDDKALVTEVMDRWGLGSKLTLAAPAD